MHLDWNFCAFKKNDTPSGFGLNADYNAALNILATWQAMSTCGAQEVFTSSEEDPACGAA